MRNDKVFMSREQHNENSQLSSTRRHALQLAAGTATAVTFATTPARAQEVDILRNKTQEDQGHPQDQDRVQWSFPTGGDVNPSPMVVNNIVFVGSFDTNLYVVDTATGDEQWVFQTDERVVSPPTVANGTVFVGSEDNNLYAVDADTGDQQWLFETGNAIFVIANGS